MSGSPQHAFAVRPWDAQPGNLPDPPKRPYCCPVCFGRGTVPHDFYACIGYSTSTGREACRSCNGRGIVIA